MQIGAVTGIVSKVTNELLGSGLVPGEVFPIGIHGTNYIHSA